jgi:putative redox protein
MKIITRMLEEEVYEASTMNGHSITIDMREASLRNHQSAPELLLSALSGCGAIDIVIMLRKRRKKVLEFFIETTGVRRDDPPRKFLDIHCKFIVVSPDVTEEELLKTAHLSIEKYCTVAASLNSHIHITVEVRRPA